MTIVEQISRIARGMRDPRFGEKLELFVEGHSPLGFGLSLPDHSFFVNSNAHLVSVSTRRKSDICVIN